MACADCRGAFDQIKGPGRPRIRCMGCSPSQAGLPKFSKGPEVQRCCGRQGCPAEFVATNGQKKYCGDACRIAACNVISQVRRRDRSERPCGGCGKRFAPAYGDMRQKYCSPSCKASAGYRRNGGGNTHVRRARRFGVHFDRFNKWDVFERDGWRCGICRIETPRSLSGRRLHNSPELDHVVPLSRGGAHSKANTRCLCRSCNLTKGVSTDAELFDRLAA